MERYGVNLLWTARYDYDKGRRLAPHRHSYYQMIWIAEGRGTYRLGEEAGELAAGMLCFIRPGTLHGLAADRHVPVKTLDIKFELASPELEALARELPARMHPPAEEVGRLLGLIREEGAGRQPFYKELASLHLAEMLYRLARFASGDGEAGKEAAEVRSPAVGTVAGEFAAARQAERWIEAHAAEDWTIETLSGQLGYSASHLRKLFRAYRGCTIPDYRRQVRIGRSKEWLAYSDWTLQQIAEKAGFKTIQHYSRVFKRLTGVTPGQWLARERRGIRKDIVFEE